MRSDEQLMNVILRREKGIAREVPKRIWHFLIRRHGVMKSQDGGRRHWYEPVDALEPSTRCDR